MGGFSSMSHWVIVLLIVILLFGAKKIPELAKGLGRGIKDFKAEMGDAKKGDVEQVEEKKEETVTTVKTEETTKA